MPENFFEPGKRSHCLFSPDLWCDRFNPAAPFSPFDFLCDISPQVVGVVLPEPEGEAGEAWNRIYSTIEQVWQRRQVGFRCQRIDPDSWTEERPCSACSLMRKAQVVVIDFQGGDLRAGGFRDMAAGSSSSLQVLKAFGGPTPNKRVIIINNGKSDPPPHYLKVFDWIDYTGPEGQPDLEKLNREMTAIAGQDLFQSGDSFSIDLTELEEESPPPALEKEVDGDLTIRILDETPIGVPSLARKTPDEQLVEALATAERLARHGRYAEAFQALQGSSELRGIDRQFRFLAAEREYLTRMEARELAETYFRGLTTRDRGRFDLSAWQDGPLASAQLVFLGEGLQRLLNVKAVTLYACDPLREPDEEELRHYLVDRPQGAQTAALFVVDNYDDRFCRWLAESCSDQVFEIHVADLRRWLLERRSPVHSLRDRLRPDYRRQEDLFLRGLHGPVCGELDFFGRRELLTRMQECLRSGDSFAVYGLPRSGKSSLFWRLARLPLEGHLLAVVDLQGLSEECPANLYARTIRAVRESILASYPDGEGSRLFETPDFSEIFSPSVSPESLRGRFESGLKTMVEAIRREIDPGFKRLVLLFDEIESVLTGEHRVFLIQLRSLMQDGSIAVGMSGLGFALRHELSNVSSPLRGAQVHVLDGLNREECSQMVRSIGHRMYRYFDDAALARIERESGGQPLLIRYLCSLILEGAPPGTSLMGEAGVQKGTDLALNEGNLRRRLVRIFDEVSRQFRVGADLLNEIARDKDITDESGADFGRLQQKTRLQRGGLESHLQILASYGLIEKGGGQLRHRIGLLHRWLRQRSEIEP